MKRLQNALVLATVLPLCAGSAFASDVITFEGLPEGALVDHVFSEGGAGPINVEASNEKFAQGQNAAIIFDSSCPPSGESSDCSGEDQDLGTPNGAFGGPGQGTQGSGGEYANRVPLGKVLIVAEDLAMDGDVVADPDDEGSLEISQISFDFSEIGPVTMESIAILDINFGHQQSSIDLLDGDGERLGDSPYELPRTENNGVIPRYLFLEDSESGTRLPVSNVSKMVVWLRGSGAIDNITFSPQIDIETLTNGKQADLAGGDDIPWIRVGQPVDWTYQVTNTSSLQLTDVVVTDSRGVEVTCPTDTLEPGEQMECGAGGSSFDLSLADLPFPLVEGQCQGRGGRPLYGNTGSVTARGAGYAVSDSDPSHYCADPPRTSIYVRKREKGPDAFGVANGSDATFQIVVWNDGTSELTGIKVADALAPDCNREFSRLAPGQSSAYDCTLPNLAIGGENVTGCSLVNEVVASGNGEGRTVSDTDTSTVELMRLTIDKNFKGAGPEAAEFEITVTNSGCDLDSVRVTDELAPGCERDLGPMAAGATESYACSMALQNEACVTGARGEGTVGACDTATFTVSPGDGGEAEGGGDGDGDGEGEAVEAQEEEQAVEPVGPEEGSDDEPAPRGMLFLLLGLLVVSGLFAWNRMKAG